MGWTSHGRSTPLPPHGSTACDLWRRNVPTCSVFVCSPGPVILWRSCTAPPSWKDTIWSLGRRCWGTRWGFSSHAASPIAAFPMSLCLNRPRVPCIHPSVFHNHSCLWTQVQNQTCDLLVVRRRCWLLHRFAACVWWSFTILFYRLVEKKFSLSVLFEGVWQTGALKRGIIAIIITVFKYWTFLAGTYCIILLFWNHNPKNQREIHFFLFFFA